MDPMTQARLNLDAGITEVETEGGSVPCAVEPHVWDGLASPQLVARAMFACDSCPVASLCAAYAASGADVHGIMAGAWRPRPWEKVPRQVQAAERIVLDTLGLDDLGLPVEDGEVAA